MLALEATQTLLGVTYQVASVPLRQLKVQNLGFLALAFGYRMQDRF